MKACNKCEKEKAADAFEVMKTGYVRPTCKECYNERRRAIQGGAKRDAEIRDDQINRIIATIPSCRLVSLYKADNSEYRIKLTYKGFDWDIRKSSFVHGLRPWKNFRHSKYKGKKCVYKFEDSEGEVLYVGKSANVTSRMSKHFSNYEVVTLGQSWKNEVTKVFAMSFDTYADMHIAEMYLINKLRPSRNKDAIEFDGTSFKLNLPNFNEFWVSAVYDTDN